MKSITAESYYLWYGNGVIGHNAYHNGIRIVSIVKRSNDYRLQLYNGSYMVITADAMLQVKNHNNFIVK